MGPGRLRTRAGDPLGWRVPRRACSARPRIASSLVWAPRTNRSSTSSKTGPRSADLHCANAEKVDGATSGIPMWSFSVSDQQVEISGTPLVTGSQTEMTTPGRSRVLMVSMRMARPTSCRYMRLLLFDTRGDAGGISGNFSRRRRFGRHTHLFFFGGRAASSSKVKSATLDVHMAHGVFNKLGRSSHFIINTGHPCTNASNRNAVSSVITRGLRGRRPVPNP